MQQLTKRQSPVLLRLQSLLDDSMAVSRAILDNTFEDSKPLPEDDYVFIRDQLLEIHRLVHVSVAAQQDHMHLDLVYLLYWFP